MGPTRTDPSSVLINQWRLDCDQFELLVFYLGQHIFTPILYNFFIETILTLIRLKENQIVY